MGNIAQKLQLKEFALISPSIEAKEVIQAIQTVITPEKIEQALEKSQGREKRKRKFGSMFSDCHELMVIRFNGDSPEKFSQWVKSSKPIHREMSSAPKQLNFAVFNSA